MKTFAMWVAIVFVTVGSLGGWIYLNNELAGALTESTAFPGEYYAQDQEPDGTWGAAMESFHGAVDADLAGEPVIAGTNMSVDGDTISVVDNPSFTSTVTIVNASPTFKFNDTAGDDFDINVNGAVQSMIFNNYPNGSNPTPAALLWDNTGSYGYGFRVYADAGGPSYLEVREDTDNGNHGVLIAGPSSVTTTVTQSLQDSAGTIALTSDIASHAGSSSAHHEQGAGAGDFLADGSVPMTGAIQTAGNDVGTASTPSGHGYFNTVTSINGYISAVPDGQRVFNAENTVDVGATTNQGDWYSLVGVPYFSPDGTTPVVVVTADGAFHDGFSDFASDEHFTQPNITELAPNVSIETTGTIGGAVSVSLDSTATVTIAVTSPSAYGSFYVNSDDDVIEYDLPNVVVGMTVGIWNQYAQVISIVPQAGENIILAGVAAANAETIVSTGAAGEYIFLIGRDATTWIATGTVGTWAEASP